MVRRLSSLWSALAWHRCESRWLLKFNLVVPAFLFLLTEGRGARMLCPDPHFFVSPSVLLCTSSFSHLRIQLTSSLSSVCRTRIPPLDVLFSANHADLSRRLPPDLFHAFRHSRLVPLSKLPMPIKQSEEREDAALTPGRRATVCDNSLLSSYMSAHRKAPWNSFLFI